MTFLEYNPNVLSRTTYHVPHKYGEPKFDKKEVFSYSLYEKGKISEVRFADQKVVKYFFGPNNFLTRIDSYDKHDILTSTKIDLLRRSSEEIIFTDWTRRNGYGNTGSFMLSENGRHAKLYFARVDSFLGNKFAAEYKLDDMGLIIEEKYSQRESHSGPYEFKFLLQNEYSLKNTKIDDLAKNILTNGWGVLPAS